jgi:ATP-dependent Clp protease ATP-binding subunit ClpC
VGYEEGGQLTEAVRRRPYSVVLLDEIEKAHPDVFNTLLQILEDGRLTDAQGKTVDFKNTVIIMTSNLGTQNLRKPTMGFGQAGTELTYDKMKERVTEELKKNFRPEFLNRIDEVIVFHELSRPEVHSIVDLLIRRVVEHLQSQDVTIELTEDSKDYLSTKGYDPSLGARPLRRAIQRYIEDPLAEKILWKEFEAGDTIIVDTAQDEMNERVIVFHKAERSPDHPPVELAGVSGDSESEASEA